MGKNLTTISNAHNTPIAKVSWEPQAGDCFASCARDSVAKVFDIKMMREVMQLRGHEKEITTLSWHPVHKNLLSTGGSDGAIFHYLLDEQNCPEDQMTVPPWFAVDKQTCPAWKINPAHKLQHAHDFAVWSLDWHPVGHLLASGSNDRVTRFWARPEPGEKDFYKDKYHIGEEAAIAAGTWSRTNRSRQAREEEMQEAQDEEDALRAQEPQQQTSALPGIGLPGPANPLGGAGGGMMPDLLAAQLAVPGIGTAQAPPAQAGPGMNPERFRQLVASGQIPPPMPPGAQSGGQFPPPPPPPGFDFSRFPQAAMPPGLQGFQPPAGFPPQPPAGAAGGIPGIGGGVTQGVAVASNNNSTGTSAAVRSRAPLPSQQESLAQELRRGNFRKPR